MDAAGIASVKVFRRRWYMLFVFRLCLSVNMFGNYVWLTWSSIQATCQLVYEWKPANVMILQGISATASLLAVIPFAWVLDTIGELIINLKIFIIYHYVLWY